MGELNVGGVGTVFLLPTYNCKSPQSMYLPTEPSIFLLSLEF